MSVEVEAMIPELLFTWLASYWISKERFEAGWDPASQSASIWARSAVLWSCASKPFTPEKCAALSFIYFYKTLSEKWRYYYSWFNCLFSGKIKLSFCAGHANQFSVIPHVLCVDFKPKPRSLIFLVKKVYHHKEIKFSCTGNHLTFFSLLSLQGEIIRNKHSNLEAL